MQALTPSHASRSGHCRQDAPSSPAAAAASAARSRCSWPRKAPTSRSSIAATRPPRRTWSPRAAPRGTKIAALQVDIRDSKACAAAVESIAERCGRIDILVNNAGTIRDNPLAGVRRRRRRGRARHQRHRRVQRHARRGAVHDLAARGPDRQHQLGRRREGRPGPDQLRGEQGRDQRVHARAGRRARAAQDQRQLRRAGRDRHRDVAATCARWRATKSRRASCSSATAGRKKSRSPSGFSLRRTANYVTGQVFAVDGGFKME